jgi:hypothetical protein
MSSASTTTGSTASSGQAGNSNSPENKSGRYGKKFGKYTKQNNFKNANYKKPSNFTGNTTEMHGHVFQVFSESNSEKQFTKTLEVLGLYVAKTMKHAHDLSPLLKTLVLPTIPQPNPLDPKATDVEKEIWKEEIKIHVARKNTLQMNLMALHAVIWGQCSPNMQAKVKSINGFDKAD